jgi:hypothetical protein
MELGKFGVHGVSQQDTVYQEVADANYQACYQTAQQDTSHIDSVHVCLLIVFG